MAQTDAFALASGSKAVMQVLRCGRARSRMQLGDQFGLALFAFVSCFGIVCCHDLALSNQTARQAPESEEISSIFGPTPRIGASGASTLAGQIAKTLVYGGASLARLNNWLLCSSLGQPVGPLANEPREPTLYVFNDRFRPERAFRIYADDQITAQMMVEAEFDSDQMTYVFVHGWLGGINNEHWLGRAKDLALSVRDSANSRLDPMDSSSSSSSSFDSDSQSQSQSQSHSHSNARPNPFRPNVIVVDWSTLATGSLYQATQQSHLVSKRLGRLLEQLSQVGQLRPELIHCIGHSIGLHICGQAARLAFPAPIRPWSNYGHRSDFRRTPTIPLAPSTKMGRITGLDPGGFCYEQDISNELKYRGMRPNDALITDAYYSNRTPFGNKYQVAQFNLRINNGFSQDVCSVWQNSQNARDYFQATVKLLFSNSHNNNDIITCDHYFATKFAFEPLDVASCSNVGYACNSYRHFVRGRCGLCDSQDQCYPMDFEYQRRNPSLEHASKHIQNHWNYSRNFNAEPEASQVEPTDGVGYANRLVYYMRMSNDATRCVQTYRIRIVLDRRRLRSLRGQSVKLRLLDSHGNPIQVFDSAREALGSEIGLHGPWRVHENEADSQLSKFGVDDCTLTALIELPARLEAADFVGELKVAALFDSSGSIREDMLLSARLDYLSSASRRTRSKLSLTLAGSQIMLVNNKRLDDLRLEAG